jgi:hypothetical protein
LTYTLRFPRAIRIREEVGAYDVARASEVFERLNVDKKRKQEEEAG